MTSSLPRKCSTTELQQQVYFSCSGAEDGAQTRDPQLGRLVLYRLSYFRVLFSLGGQRWIRTTEGVRQQIYSLPHLATLVFALPSASQSLVTRLFFGLFAAVWTTNCLKTAAKVGIISESEKLFKVFFIDSDVFP